MHADTQLSVVHFVDAKESACASLACVQCIEKAKVPAGLWASLRDVERGPERAESRLPPFWPPGNAQYQGFLERIGMFEDQDLQFIHESFEAIKQQICSELDELHKHYLEAFRATVRETQESIARNVEEFVAQHYPIEKLRAYLRGLCEGPLSQSDAEQFDEPALQAVSREIGALLREHADPAKGVAFDKVLSSCIDQLYNVRQPISYDVVQRLQNENSNQDILFRINIQEQITLGGLFFHTFDQNLVDFAEREIGFRENARGWTNVYSDYFAANQEIAVRVKVSWDALPLKCLCVGLTDPRSLHRSDENWEITGNNVNVAARAENSKKPFLFNKWLGNHLKNGETLEIKAKPSENLFTI